MTYLLVRALGLACISTLFVGTAAAAQVVPPVQSALSALAQDGAEYSASYGISLTDAVARLQAQEESVAVTEDIRRLYADRLTGISIEHQPGYRIIVLLTGDAPVADRTISAGGIAVPIMFRTGARATRAQLVAAIMRHQAAIRSGLRRPPGLGVDPRTGELVVIVKTDDVGRGGPLALRARFEALTGVPVRIDVTELTTANAMIEGGARVVGVDPADGRRYACTTGFVVTDGARAGIATAAHCPDELSYVGRGGVPVPLPFAGQWGWSYRDVQINLSDQATQPLFHADSAKTAPRTLTGWRNRESTRAGDFVCHRGESSGYSCSEVAMVDYAPPGDLCGGPCSPAWVAVRGPQCRSGDSGGPVFLGGTAFGITKGASYGRGGVCGLYFYMSTDYLPENWRLLHAQLPVPAALPPRP